MWAHQPFDAATAVLPAFRPQGGVHPGRSITSPCRPQKAAHIVHQRLLCIPCRRSRHEPVKYDKRRYRRRSRIEIVFTCLKD